MAKHVIKISKDSRILSIDDDHIVSFSEGNDYINNDNGNNDTITISEQRTSEITKKLIDMQKEMTDLTERTSSLGGKIATAQNLVGDIKKHACASVFQRKCAWCGDYVNIRDFRDELSIREYKISGLCQHCQDYMFNEKDDNN
jgi:hypothetical protein